MTHHNTRDKREMTSIPFSSHKYVRRRRHNRWDSKKDEGDDVGTEKIIKLN